MAVGPRYLDLVQSEVGFGVNPQDARDSLAEIYARMPGVQIEVPPLSGFTIWPSEGGEPGEVTPIIE